MNPTLSIGDLDSPRLESSVLAAQALTYGRRGWAVFPLAPKSKVPLIGKKFGGRGYLDATRDLAQIAKWWAECPQANIGIATGAPSGFFVLDVDPRHEGDKTLDALIQRHGPLPDTLVSLTGGGGRHFLFRHVAGIGNSASRLGAGLDVRGDGGYIVAPPSAHENGRIYAWDSDHCPDAAAIADASLWLLARVRLAVKAKAERGNAIARL